MAMYRTLWGKLAIVAMVTVVSARSAMMNTRSIKTTRVRSMKGGVRTSLVDNSRALSSYPRLGGTQLNRMRSVTMPQDSAVDINRKGLRVNSLEWTSALGLFFGPLDSIFKAATVATVAGGALSGGLHAISGPDHLAALLPRCIGQRWWRAGRIALIWGSGHGLSTIILGMMMWGLKEKLTGGLEDHGFFMDISRFSEGAVGISLMLIGIIGLREAASWNDEELMKLEEKGNDSNAKFRNGAIFVNGVLHGCSLDGLQTLAPALALNTWRAALVFMLAHYIGTAVSMAACTATVGEGSVRVGKALKKPEIVRSLSRGSSLIALLVGAVFTIRAVLDMA